MNWTKEQQDAIYKKDSNILVAAAAGSGKTAVAAALIYSVIKNGYQATLMVPTEILANQHYLEAKKLLEPFGIHIELLTGSTSLKEKRRIKELIKFKKLF